MKNTKADQQIKDLCDINNISFEYTLDYNYRDKLNISVTKNELLYRNTPYFNVILNQRTSESKEYGILEEFAHKYNTIKIEPNGLYRVSIFPNNL